MYGKKKLKKFLVLNITLVFVTVSMMNNVVGFVNNEIDNNINDSNKNVQNNLNSGSNYAIFWPGNASVDYLDPHITDVNLFCDPDCEMNISIKGPDLNLIFLLGTNISLRFDPIIKYTRIAKYQVIIDIDDDIRYDKSLMKIIDPGARSNILGIGYLLKNAINRTVKIKMETQVCSQKPRSPSKYCTRTIILNIKEGTRAPTNKCNNYEVIWGANTSVEYNGLFNINKNLVCDPDSEYNISICGPNLYLIFLLGTKVSLKYNPLFPLPRIAGYSLYIEIDNAPRADTSRMRIIEPGSNSNILGVGYKLENACNKIVKITLKSNVYSLIPIRLPESCERTVVLHVNCEQ